MVRESVKELVIVMAKDCPHCHSVFKTRAFRRLSRRKPVRVYDLQHEHYIQELTALYVGITEKERLLWLQGAPRGTLKTPMVVAVADDGVTADLPLAVDEFQLWLAFNTALAALGDQVMPPPAPPKPRKREAKG